ncbi:MAG: alpha-ketoacid dehydrogenase subunit beta [Chloroflexi bacterium]|nr:alpha-ketoacid dehydrogenase subunit beta [Chloroflexota bacterium]
MRELTYWQGVQEALTEEMARDEMVFLLGEDIGVYGGAFGVTRGMLERFGSERVRNTPVSEAAIVGVALGAAVTGMRPVVEIMFMDFITLAMDQLVNHAAKMHYIFGDQAQVPLVVRTPAGGWRSYGPSHSQSWEAWFLHTPGLKVVAPATPYDAKGLLKTAIRDDNPVLFVEHKLLYATKGPVPQEEYTVPLGQAHIKRAGRDVTLVTYSYLTLMALEVAQELEKENIGVEVIDLRSLSPLDINQVVASVKKTGRVVIAEEGHKTGGVGAEVGMQIQERAYEYLDAPIQRVAAKDVPIPFSYQLEKHILPSKEDIYRAVTQVMAQI